MELAVITAKQVAELLLMILAGAVCCKAGVFKPKEKSVLANLLLYLVVPAMVLDSYMVEYDPATFHNLMLAFGLGALVLLVGLGVAFLASFKVQKDARAILWFACAFSNAGYMGFPLIKALFGGEVEARAQAADRADEGLTNAFAFLDAAIPDSQELVLFATELTANWFTSWFIQNFGCDAYFAHNKKLLFDDTRAQLLQDIDAAKQEKDN